MDRSVGIKEIANFAAVYIIWGSTYLAIRFGIETLPPLLMTGVRFMTGGLLFYTWARLFGVAKPTPVHWRSALVTGSMMVCATGLVAIAEHWVDSGITALIVALVPIWVVVIDWLRPGGLRPALPVVLGLVLGFVGIVFLINPFEAGGFDKVYPPGALLIVIGTVSWAGGSVYSRYAALPKSATLSVGMQMFAGGAALSIAGLIRGEAGLINWELISAKSVLALVYLITLGSLAFASYIWLMKNSTPARAATYAYVNPVIALFLGHLLADEPITWWTLMWAGVIVAAVSMIVTTRGKRLQKHRQKPKPEPLTAPPRATR